MTTTTCHIQLFSRGPGEPVRWRLLSGNNREVGRSADDFPDVMSCQDAVRDEQSRARGATVRLRRTELNRWRWELHREGVPVVVAGHTFDRQIRCEMALAAFFAAFPSAPVRPGLVMSGSRRGAYA